MQVSHPMGFTMSNIFQVVVQRFTTDDYALESKVVGAFSSLEAAQECAAAIEQQIANADSHWKENRGRLCESVTVLSPVTGNVEEVLRESARFFEINKTFFDWRLDGESLMRRMYWYP